MCIEAVTDISQIEIVEQLADEIWHEHFTAIIGRKQVDYMLDKFQSKAAIAEQIRNGCLYFIIYSDDKPAGYMAVQPKATQLFLSKLYIISVQRGKGLGRKAIEFAVGLANEKAVTRITLTVNRHNTAAIAAYKRLGFEITGSAVQDIGGGFVMDDYLMEKAVMQANSSGY